MPPKNDPASTRAAVMEIASWIRAPEDHEKPARSALAEAVRRTARALAAELPGHTVEVRIPPFVAVQCVEGPKHTRGTPPNVVETDPITWLHLATGISTLDDEITAGNVDASGSRATEIVAGLPVTGLIDETK
ncbi:sterol carrier family protein [Corynebacterium cystitidis]|uniref:sterol carrier family protein n=1 Tax=Corynebacterium cystitidis TaxID=35757 RepID=UPI00211DCEEE|nr:sterol carrier family protein [Corynebacterium cystitidis]